MVNYTINIYQSIDRAYIHPEDQIDRTWDEVVEGFFTECVETEDKHSVPLFNLVKLKTSDYEVGERSGKEVVLDGVPAVARRKANMLEVHGLMLDVDGKHTMEEFVEKVKDFEFVIYTTHSHTEAKHKFRVVMPFDKPMPVELFMGYKLDICKTFNVDNASFSLSQCFYLPSRRPGMPYVLERNHGSLVDWQGFVYTEPPKFDDTPREYTGEFKGHVYSPEEVQKALMSCSDFHYVPSMRGGSLALGAICKGFGLSKLQFDQVCRSLSTSESMQVAKHRDSVWQKAPDKCKVRTLKDFLEENGATYMPRKTQELLKPTERVAESLEQKMKRMKEKREQWTQKNK